MAKLNWIPRCKRFPIFSHTKIALDFGQGHSFCMWGDAFDMVRQIYTYVEGHLSNGVDKIFYIKQKLAKCVT